MLSANVLIQIISFGAQLFVAGILTPEDVGRIKILQTFLAISTIVGGLGFTNSTLKLCSENRSDEETREIFNAGFFFTLFFTSIAYLLVLVISAMGWLGTDKVISALIPLALFPLISNSLFSVFVSFYLAKKQVQLLSRLTVINKLLSVVGIVLLSYFLGIKGYYWAFNIGILIILLVCIKKEFKILQNPFKLSLKSHRRLFQTHWFYAKPAFATNVFADLSAYVDILLINFLVSDMREIGYYGFALTLVLIVRLIPATVQQITLPYYSELSVDIPKFIQAHKKYSKLLILIIAATLTVVLIVAAPGLQWLFSGKYEQSIQYFIPLSIGWSIRAYNQIQSSALFGLGKIDYTAYGQFFTFIFSITVLLLGWCWFGLLGIAYSSILCGIFRVFLHELLFRKHLKNVQKSE